MIDVAKFPYLTARNGSSNLYYKREVPPELRADGRPSQIWRSLRTGDQKKAQAAYGAQHAEVEALFAQWRKEESRPVAGQASTKAASGALPTTLPMTPALLRRLADAHYLNVYDNDFHWRGDLWKKVHEDENAFWRGEIIKLPEDDWHEFRGNRYSYFALLMEEPVLEDVFLYSIFRARKATLQRLQRQYQLGDSRDHGPVADSLLRSKGISLADADRSRLMRKLMDIEIKALEDITAGDEATFDGILSREAIVEAPLQSVSAAKPGELVSRLVEKYLDEWRCALSSASLTSALATGSVPNVMSSIMATRRFTAMFLKGALHADVIRATARCRFRVSSSKKPVSFPVLVRELRLAIAARREAHAEQK
jgi:hypothetical protein